MSRQLPLDEGAFFDVELHRMLEEAETTGLQMLTLKLKGDWPLKGKLRAGDVLTVTVHDADGGVISSGRCDVGYPQFKAISEKGIVIGTERIETAERER